MPLRCELLDELRVLAGLHHFGGELVDDRLRRSRGRQHAGPRHRVVARIGFRDRRHVRQRAERLSLDTASMRMFGLVACATASEIGTNVTGMCPPITSVSAGAVPR